MTVDSGVDLATRFARNDGPIIEADQPRVTDVTAQNGNDGTTRQSKRPRNRQPDRTNNLGTIAIVSKATRNDHRL
jgi:hypothetical protein